MRRTLLEILALGGVAILVGGLYQDVSSLRETDRAQRTEIAGLHAAVAADAERRAANLPARVDQNQTDLSELRERLVEMTRELTTMKDDFDRRATQAEKRATEAFGENQRLSQSVQSAEHRFHQETANVARFAGEVRSKLRDHEGLLQDLTTEVVRDTKAMTMHMLSPAVQLTGEETVGSGTLVACIRRKNGPGFDTYVLTAHHVIRNILADEPQLKRDGIECIIYTKNGKISRRADVLATNPAHDIGLLRLRGDEKVENTARLISPKNLAKITVWTPVYAVGCPLGNDPIPTSGFVSSLDNEVAGTKYWMINAPTYYGNSGGAIFHGQLQEMIAIFSKIYTHGRSRPIVIPHMGLAVPMTLVYPWLRQEGYGFLIPHDEGAVMATPGK